MRRCVTCGAASGERHDPECLYLVGVAESVEVLRPDRPHATAPWEARATLALKAATQRALVEWLRSGETIACVEQARRAA